ncbi:MAG: Ni/Fe-hydrogenase, b-type cytochrome subunit [Enterobacteriaceae bacterium]
MNVRQVRSHGYYIYDAPVRLWHWLSALSILVLAVTGYFIGKPLPSQPGEATFVFVMGWLRLIHFSAAYIFTIALLFRLYWALVGNEYAREMFYLPLWKGSWWREFWHKLRWYLFLEKHPQRYLGHNPVEQLALLGFFLLCLFMIFSGFALYAEGLGIDSWAYHAFGWMITLFGGNSLALHFWHRLGMWLVVVFVIIHIYTAVREELAGNQSMVSTMISGWRWFRD